MSLSIQYVVEAGCLRVTATGEFSPCDANRSVLEVLEAVAKHGVEKVLVDLRQVHGNPSTGERYGHGQFMAEQVAAFRRRHGNRSLRFAYLARPPLLDPDRFTQVVAVNRGAVVGSFERPEDALAWLVPPSPPPGGR